MLRWLELGEEDVVLVGRVKLRVTGTNETRPRFTRFISNV